MVRAFFREVSVPNDGGKGTRKELVQGRHGLVIRVDEGQVVQALGARQGQTTMTVLRSMFSGETLGGAYVSSAHLEAHTYRVAVLMGIQPELAHFLFSDGETAGGTPQRFVWLSTIDPDIPELEDLDDHPGVWRWQPPTITDPGVDDQAVNLGGIGRRWQFTVSDGIADELRAAKRDRLRGHATSALDAHAALVRLKVAAALASLDGRPHVNLDDWALAGTVTDTSGRVRDWVLRRISHARARKDAAYNERAAERAGMEEVGRAAATATVDRVAAVIGRHVHRHAREDGNDGCTRRCISQAVGRDRRELDAAIGRAIAAGWIQEGDSTYRPGESQPAGRAA
jgi:hypothetical protein